MRHLFDRPLGTSVPNGYLVKSIGAETAGAFISALGSIGSAGLGGVINSAASERQHQYNQVYQQAQAWIDEQKMKQAYDYTNALMDKENVYNSPAAQMQRYREAGLNPFLAAGSSVGSGLSSSKSAPSPSSTGMPSAPHPIYPDFHLGDSTASLLMQASSIQNQRIEAFAKIADAAPKLFNAVGEDAGTKILESIFGQTVENGDLKRLAKAAVVQSESEATIAEVKAHMDQVWSPKEREQNWAAGEQAISESFARLGMMSSDAKVNEAKIKELASSIVRNVADAWKLRKEGEKFAADAATVNALRSFVVSQAKSYSQMASNQSFMTGADPLSPIHDFLYSKGHVKSVIQGKSITDEQYSSELIRALDKVLGEYVKVSNGAAPTYNFGNTYNIP